MLCRSLFLRVVPEYLSENTIVLSLARVDRYEGQKASAARLLSLASETVDENRVEDGIRFTEGFLFPDLF